MSTKRLSSHVFGARPTSIDVNKSEAALKVINAKFMSAVKNIFSISTVVRNHENLSENLIALLKNKKIEQNSEGNNLILFLKWTS